MRVYLTPIEYGISLFFYAKGDKKMITSKITGKSYEPSEGIYISNPIQCQKYFKHLGEEFFLDILYTSYKREDWRMRCARRRAGGTPSARAPRSEARR